MAEMPDELNEAHQLVIVASERDAQTERIVSYLADEHAVDINVLFFRVLAAEGLLIRSFRELDAFHFFDGHLSDDFLRSARECRRESLCRIFWSRIANTR